MSDLAAQYHRAMLFAYELTVEHKAEFLRLIYEGYRADDAAKEVGTSATQFRRLRNPTGEHHDPDFTKAYKEAATSDENRQNFLERIREAVWKAASGGNARLLEKLSLIYDPDWEPLKHQNFHMNVELVARVLPYLSAEELERAIAAAEAESLPKAELKMLPPAS